MKIIKHLFYKISACTLLAAMLLQSAPCTGTAFAAEEFAAQMEQRKDASHTVQRNRKLAAVSPAIGAQSAILMEMNTHTILYAKNIHEKSYPASTTKILTCLLAMQNCTMDEVVTFSHDAIYDVPVDGPKLGGVDTGDTITMEQALYCVLCKVCKRSCKRRRRTRRRKAHQRKSVKAFAELMNQK